MFFCFFLNLFCPALTRTVGSKWPALVSSLKPPIWPSLHFSAFPTYNYNQINNKAYNYNQIKNKAYNYNQSNSKAYNYNQINNKAYNYNQTNIWFYFKNWIQNYIFLALVQDNYDQSIHLHNHDAIPQNLHIITKSMIIITRNICLKHTLFTHLFNTKRLIILLCKSENPPSWMWKIKDNFAAPIIQNSAIFLWAGRR